jgi:DNA-directed RNA polymerase I subunit RPA2
VAAEEESERERKALATGQNVVQDGLRVAISSSQVLGPAKGADLDIVAIPFVFRYLCAELASMGIAVSLEVR